MKNIPTIPRQIKPPAKDRSGGLSVGDLIAVLEQGEPSRELDVRIWLALFDTPIMVDGGGYGPKASAPKYKQAREIWKDDWPYWGEKIEVDAVALSLDAPHYTTSIDAALTLVPDGWNWHLITEFDGINAAVFPPGNAVDYPDVTASTPALALCIAALKARQ